MLLFCDVEQLVLVYGGRRSLPLQLEDHDTSVVTGGEEVDLRVGSNDPESVHIPLEGLDRSSLVQVPSTNCLVLADREDEVLVGVEETGGGVLEMAAAGIDFPCFCIYRQVELVPVCGL